MPELPDVALYVDALGRHFQGQTLENLRIASPFLIRSVSPPVTVVKGLRVIGFRRMGKRVVWEMEDDLFLVFHLMVTGRFHLRKKGAGLRRKLDLAAFDFPERTLMLTEAGSKKRASLHVIRGEKALAGLDPGGLELFEASPEEFAARLTAENRTLKRRLTDPRAFSGVGNAYSDEILHAAGLSPFKRTRDLTEDECGRLFAVCQNLLRQWCNRLRAETGDGFPEKVTAFHDDFAVHGRFRKPCPACGTPVQRIVYAENEANYCPRCQTGGKLLSDRALARLLLDDWPKTIEGWESLMNP